MYCRLLDQSMNMRIQIIQATLAYHNRKHTSIYLLILGQKEKMLCTFQVSSDERWVSSFLTKEKHKAEKAFEEAPNNQITLMYHTINKHMLYYPYYVMIPCTCNHLYVLSYLLPCQRTNNVWLLQYYLRVFNQSSNLTPNNVFGFCIPNVGSIIC